MRFNHSTWGRHIPDQGHCVVRLRRSAPAAAPSWRSRSVGPAGPPKLPACTAHCWPAKAAGYDYPLLDGTLIETDRITTPGSTPGGVNVIEVFFIRETLGGSATTFGLVSAAWSAGMLPGAWFAARLARRLRRRVRGRGVRRLHVAAGVLRTPAASVRAAGGLHVPAGPRCRCAVDLLVRRHRRTGELAFHYCYQPDGQPKSHDPADPRRRTTLVSRGGLRVRQGRVQPRPVPGPPLRRDHPPTRPRQ
ncbi:hypothetical protein F8271_08630 [Micromonospora sp. ALFpr18c]|nr:hypothetical protein F8271_08630 [Micromonospora sp. ALFpr18c]